MPVENYYELLGVKPDATEQEIKSAYRKRAREFHPDSAGGSEEKFQKLADAYETLSDHKARQIYDLKFGLGDILKEKISLYEKSQEQIKAESKKKSTAYDSDRAWSFTNSSSQTDKKKSGRFSGPTANSAKPNETADNASSIRDRLRKGFQVFSGKQTGESTGARRPLGARSAELRGERVYQFTVDALESLQGTSRELALDGGDTPRIIRVKIPAGVQDGATIRVDCPETGSQPAGSVSIRVNVKSHDLVERDGLDVIVKVPITVGEAINGAELEVPTLDGRARVKLPPHSVGGHRLRLKGRGARDESGKIVGDLYVKPYVVMPENVNESVRYAAQAIDAGYTSDVRSKLPRSLTSKNSE